MNERMKKLVVSVAALVIPLSVFGGAGAVDASAYPPNGNVVTVEPSVGPPGFVATVDASCTPGETVRVDLGAQSARGSCDRDGAVSIDIGAPRTPGTHEGDVTGASSGLLGGFVVTVEPVAAGDGGQYSLIGATESESAQIVRMMMLAGVAFAVVVAVAIQRQRLFA